MSVAVSNTTAALSGKTLTITDASQTLTNKTLTSPTITTPTITSPSIATPTITGETTLTGGQITFPATQAPSSGANTLDDYEEGTWTPVLGGAGGTSGQTYGTQVGSYIKIGKLVMAYFDLTLTAKGTITGNCQISGLPFAADSGGTLVASFSVAFVGLVSTWAQVMGIILASTSVAPLIGMTVPAVSNNTALTTADIANTTVVRGTIVYRASA